MSHLLGPNVTQPRPGQGGYKGKLTEFSQAAFAPATAVMADTGFLYVPPGCSSHTACRLHVAFHGCNMAAERVGTAYVTKGGYLEVADANNIVVLFPQMKTSLVNPMGCWDWMGYTGIYYAFRSGPQMRAVHAMVAALRR